jgi:hypothetical protein
MHLELLDLVCKKEQVSPLQVFFLAYERIEPKKTEEEIAKIFLCNCKPLNNRHLLLVDMPELVEDYCLDILAKRIKMPPPKEYILYIQAT